MALPKILPIKVLATRAVQKRVITSGGFSILETLVTMAVLSLILVTTTANLPTLIRTYEQNNALKEFDFQLRRAKGEAVAKGARAIISFSGAGTIYTLGIDHLPYNDPVAPDIVLHTRTFPNDITGVGLSDIIFDSRGFLVDSNGNYTTLNYALIKDSDVFAYVTIYPTGAITHDTLL